MGPEGQMYEKLFLLEFLVDHVVVFNSNLQIDKKFLDTLGPLIVKFQFLDFPSIEVNEEDFSTSTKPLMEDKKILLKAGRSCMFSMSNLEDVKCESRYDIRVNVSRTMPDSEDYFIGKTKINMFNAFKSISEKPCDGADVSQTKAGAYKLMNDNGDEVGKIVFLVRLSCFGKMVVTEFQLSEEEAKAHKYRHDRKLCEVKPDQGSDEMIKKVSSDKGKPKEKVEKPQEKVEKPKPSEDSKDKVCPFGYPKPPAVCECPCAKAGGFGQVGGYPLQPLDYRQPLSQPAKMKDMQLDPGSLGIRGNQLVFQMPTKPAEHPPADGKFASSVYYTMNDSDVEGARNIVKILPEVPGDALGSKLSEKQDVLVLKLGKKRMAAGKLPKLELELRTPKMKEEKPETDTQHTQYMDSDIPKPPPTAGSKKGKKGKK